MLLKKTSIFCVFLSLFLSCSFVHAQSIPGIQNPLVISVIPSEPRANQTTIINLQSFSLDLDRSLVTWFVDGVSSASGVGLKEFRVLAGPSGSTKVVDVTVATLSSGTFKDSVIIRPADVGLVWESDTYVPPFYQGKALHSYNGTFKVIAVPEMYTAAGAKIDSKDLIYTWKKNGEVEGAASGYGRNTYIGKQTSYLREGEDISVQVSAPRDNVVASNSIILTPIVPKVVFYEKSPLYGAVYERSLKARITLQNEEISIIAEPFFFSVKSREAGNLSYQWKLDNTALNDFANESEVTLRRTDDEAGRATLNVALQNSIRLLQGASQSLNIFYE